MLKGSGKPQEKLVALLAEGVDRNTYKTVAFNWVKVALLAEGVDRNQSNRSFQEQRNGRPPRGGRG